MKYYLGVDGGGSKTTAVAANSLGEVVAVSVGGSINYYSNPLDVTRSNMASILAEIADKCGVSHFDGGFIGMSALGERASDEETARFAHGIVDAQTLRMDSDLFVAMQAMNTDGCCAVVVSGTGSMVIARFADGSVHHAGGWGYLLGDEGSGYTISLEAIKAGIRGFEGSGEKTLLTEALLDYFSTRDIYSLIDKFYNPPMERQAIAAYLPVVRECAQKGDACTVRLLEAQAHQLAATALSLLEKLPEGTPVGLWGGVFQHTPLFRDIFSREIGSRGYCAQLLRYPPEIGAVFAAYRQCGIEITQAMLSNIERTYAIL